MAIESRMTKSMMNAKVNLVFMLISVSLAFFSRKVFLDNLGIDFVGLTTTLQSILGFLNLAELGVGAAIAVTLYKPLSQGDKKEINDIICVLSFLYRRIGCFILLAGVIFSIFLPFVLGKENISLGVVYYAYYVFLVSTLFSYFINYAQTLLTADQKNYVVTKYLQSSNILKLCLQMGLVSTFSNLYLWVTIELVFSVIYCYILNRKIQQTYPWLQSSYAKGKSDIKKYPKITQFIKQIFIQKIAIFVQGQMTPLIVFGFSSLNVVALYGNYLTVSGKLSLFVNALLGSTEASVGNLIAENNKIKILNVYKELTLIRFFIAGFYVFMLYHLLEPFIALWLGNQYLMPKSILIAMLLNVFISQYRGATDQFLNGYGLFKDVWASWLQVILFVIQSVIGGYLFGLLGILLGGVLSTYLIIGIWKPYFLYGHGFQIPVSKYWNLWCKHCLIILCSFLATHYISHIVPFKDCPNFFYWTLYALEISVVYIFITFIFYFLFCPEFLVLVSRIKILKK